MPFESTLQVMLLDDRAQFPWLTVAPLVYECPLTGETYEVPKNFRTDFASIPIALASVPVVGQLLVMRYFGGGVFMGAKQGVLHDWLRRELVVPAKTAHLIFREALYDGRYPEDMVENYYSAVKLFNS
jgi:hypothetical protein